MYLDPTRKGYPAVCGAAPGPALECSPYRDPPRPRLDPAVALSAPAFRADLQSNCPYLSVGASAFYFAGWQASNCNRNMLRQVGGKLGLSAKTGDSLRCLPFVKIA